MFRTLDAPVGTRSAFNRGKPRFLAQTHSVGYGRALALTKRDATAAGVATKEEESQ
jgi:hypothetical protein